MLRQSQEVVAKSWNSSTLPLTNSPTDDGDDGLKTWRGLLFQSRPGPGAAPTKAQGTINHKNVCSSELWAPRALVLLSV